MSPDKVERCLSDYVDAVNAHDVPRMLADRHPDATLTLMGTPQRIESSAALDRFYRRFFAANPGYRLRVEDGVYRDDLGVVWGWVAGPAAEEVPVVFVCTFEDDRFRHDRMYADFTQLAVNSVRTRR